MRAYTDAAIRIGEGGSTGYVKSNLRPYIASNDENSGSDEGAQSCLPEQCQIFSFVFMFF